MGEGVNEDTTENIFIEGENLEVLKILRKSYMGKIKMIYIDPPYNTGGSLTYRDKFQVTDWVSQIRPTMILAHSLLKSSGVMMISIDDGQMRPHLDLILQDIFGIDNRLPEMIWKGKSGGNDGNHIRKQHEYVLCFAKNLSDFKSTELFRKASDSEFPQVDEETGRRYWRQSLRQGGNRSRREDSPTLHYPITTPDGNEVYPRFPDGSDGVWRWSPPKLERELAEGNVEFRRNNKGQLVVEQKMWQTDTKKVYNDSLLPESTRDTRTGTNTLIDIFGGKPFDYPKPVELLEYLINFAGGKDAVVLDFFAGSGTTGHAVASLNAKDGGNRQAILVTNNENNIFYDTTYIRFERALTGAYAKGNVTPLSGSIVCFKVEFVDVTNSSGEVKTDYDLMELMSNKFSGIASLKEGVYDVEEHTGYFVCRGVVDGLNKTVLVWCDIYDDDDLEDVLESVNPDVAYLACESLSIYGNSLAKFDCDANAMPLKFVKTTINSQNYSSQGEI